MPIYVPRTTLPQEPVTPSMAGGGVAPVQQIGNPAAALAGTAEQAGSLAARIYQEERDREVQTRVLELDIDRRRRDAAVVGDYLQRRGKEAVEAREQVFAAIQANSKAVREGVKDRAVLDVWAQQDAALNNAAVTQLDAHFRQQNVRWQADTHEARSKLLQNDLGRVAFGEGYNPETGALSVEAERTRSAYIDSLGELGAVLGWTPEQIELERRAADTAAFGQVAESLLRQERFGEAQRVLERHGDRIDVGVRDRLAAAARIGTTRDQAYTVANAPELAALTLPDKLKAIAAMRADGKITTEVMDLAARRVVDDTTTMRLARETANAELLKEATDWLDANQGAELDGLGAPLIERLQKAGMWDEVEAYSVDHATTRPDGFARMMVLLDHPGSLKGVSWESTWRSFRTVLSNRHLGVVQELWQQQNGQGGRSGASGPPQTELVSDERFKISLAQQLEILAPGVEDEKQIGMKAGAYSAFLMRLEDDVNASERLNGKRMTRDEIRAVVKGYKEQQAEFGGQKVFLPLMDPKDAVRAVVVANGQRVSIGEVLRGEDDPEGAGIRTEFLQLVDDYNAERRRLGQQQLDRTNPAHVAQVVAEVRAVQAEQNAVRRHAAAERASRSRFEFDRAAAAEAEFAREWLRNGHPLEALQQILRPPEMTDEERRFIESQPRFSRKANGDSRPR